jgi:hypothetical protein
MCPVASSWGGRVRVWQITSGDGDSEGGQPLPQGLSVDYALYTRGSRNTGTFGLLAAGRTSGPGSALRVG